MKGIKEKRITNSKQVITIFNILRSIGLNTSNRGTKYINKAIQLIAITDSDIIVINDIYKKIAKIYGNLTPKQVKNDISYALNTRIENKALENFKKIFGFEYDSYYFTNKIIIEEIVRIIKYDTNN